MKITKEQLKQIIKEELDNVLESSSAYRKPSREWAEEIGDKIKRMDDWENMQPDLAKADVVRMGMDLEDLRNYLINDPDYGLVGEFVHQMLQPQAER